MTNEIIEVIKKVKQKITDRSDVTWISYETPAQLRDELEVYVNQFHADDMSSLEKIKMLFLPTGTLQEHSICNGWTDEFLNLSKEFDRLYMAIKGHT